MDIQQKLFKFRHCIIGTLTTLLAIFIFFYFLPYFIKSILFSIPLLISTALFAALVAFFTHTTPPNDDPIPIPREIKEIIDYIVAGYNQYLHHLDDHNHPGLPPLENVDELPPHDD